MDRTELYKELEKVAPEIKQKAIEILKLYKKAWPDGKYLKFAFVATNWASLSMDCDYEGHWQSPLDWVIWLDEKGNEIDD